jgi:ABC-2 type transport system permease protein
MNTPMNPQSNAVPDSSVDAHPIKPPALSVTRPFYWSVRRELWENRSIYIAPLAAGAVFLLGFLISLTRLPHQIRALSSLEAAQQQENLMRPYDFAAGLIMATTLIVGVFYCLDALHGERRDRSILFWKSLPVSDLTTVLSKASIPLVVLPLLTIAITVATHWIMLLLSTVVVAGSGLSVRSLWAHLPLFQMSLMLFYHLLTVHVLSHAPFYCWLLLVSCWARRAVFLWAALPVLVIAVVERVAFNTSYFVGMLGRRFGGGSEAVAFHGRMPIEPGMQLTPGNFLSSPGLWIGLVVAGIFLATAVRMRRYREAI